MLRQGPSAGLSRAIQRLVRIKKGKMTDKTSELLDTIPQKVLKQSVERPGAQCGHMQAVISACEKAQQAENALDAEILAVWEAMSLFLVLLGLVSADTSEC